MWIIFRMQFIANDVHNSASEIVRYIGMLVYVYSNLLLVVVVVLLIMRLIALIVLVVTASITISYTNYTIAPANKIA